MMIIKTRLGMQETLTWKCKHTVANEDTMYGEAHTHAHIYSDSFGKQVEGVGALYFSSVMCKVYI